MFWTHCKVAYLLFVVLLLTYSDLHPNHFFCTEFERLEANRLRERNVQLETVIVLLPCLEWFEEAHMHAISVSN